MKTDNLKNKIEIVNNFIKDSMDDKSLGSNIELIILSARASLSLRNDDHKNNSKLIKEINNTIKKINKSNLLTKTKTKMRTIFVTLTLSVLLFSGFAFRDHKTTMDNKMRPLKLYCPPFILNSVNTCNKNSESSVVNKDENSIWYQNAIKNISKEEYNISYSNEYNTYQSPNRANNMRFIYHKDGFTAKNRISDSTDVIQDWEIKLRIKNYELRAEDELRVNENRASIENGNIRIDYINTEEGMRQDFIVKNKPDSYGKLRLDFSADTKLKMIVGADALMFKDRSGNDRLKYSALKCWDANGKDLRAHFEKSYKLQVTNYESDDNNDIVDSDQTRNSSFVTCNSFSIIVNDEDAVYPITIDPLSTTASWTKTGTQGEEQFGFSAATAGDVNGDGYSDIVIGAPEFDNVNDARGKAYVYYGSATGPSATPNWTKEEISGFALSERFGYSVATAGDVNGDGYSDLIVGAQSYSTSISLTWSQGKAFVYHGSASGLSATANWSATVAVTNAWFGASVSCAGDVNGDGYSDVVVGCPFWGQSPSTIEGKAFVYHGSASGLSGSPNWSSNVGAPYDQQYASSVSTAGDVNGDGYSDILVGQNRYNSNIFAGYNEGRVFAFYGSSTGLSATANWTKIGPQQSFFGISISTAGDVNGDGYSDAVIGAYQATGGQEGEGRVYVYNGSSTGLSANPNWIAESNQPYASLGTFVSTAGDVNGDGYADIIASAPQYSNGQNSEGAVFGWFGSATGLGANGTPANADWMVESNEDTAYFGDCVATAGDVNGDGYSDVLISSNQKSNNVPTREGKVSLFTGSASGLATQSGWSNEGAQDNAYYGYSVASAGDVNGDGYSDVIVGAYLYDNGQTDEGRIYIYHGSSTGLNPTANTVSESNSANAQFGYSVSTAGDVNGDGFSDVIVGGPNWTGSGRVYVFHGSLAGINTVWNYGLNADGSGEYFGCSVSTAGDVNGDGYSDVIVGAENYSNGQSQEGRAYIFNGSSTGLNTSYSWVAEANQTDARYGHSVSTAGDVNGDGYSDVVVGAWTYDNGQNDEGAAWIYYGSVSGISGSTLLEINLASANFGSSVASAGDVNGDGYSDVIIGASSYSNPEFLEGAAFEYNGSASGINTTPSWQIQSNQTLTNLGISVAGAGDVNGDGYSDVIVGAFNFENGQTDEGKIQVHQGSQTGLSTTPSWTIESNTASANLGVSVASAGDVNGDGYSDVLAGAYRLSNGNTAEGKAFVYYGGGGSGNSRTTVQQYSPGSSTVVGSGGLTYSNGQVKLAIYGKSPFGITKAKINHEYKQNGFPFSGNIISNGTGSTGTGNFSNLGLSGSEIFHNIDGLQTGKLYKWRARVQYDLASNPYQKLGPWKYYNNYMPLPNGNFRPSNGLTLNKVLNLSMLIQGFYNASANTTVQDTVTVYIRNSTAPFAKVDSAKAIINSTGQAVLNFTNVVNGVNYYLQITHRNSLETWSKTVQTFSASSMSYDFRTDAAKAFGDNMISVDASPVRFAVYSGDINKDGAVDLTDVTGIYNASNNFLSGYVSTDLNGDNVVDLTDVTIGYNNSAAFVVVEKP